MRYKMKFEQVLKKAMIDKDIGTAKALSEASGVSYYIVNRLLRGDKSCTLNSLVEVASFLDVDVKFIQRGE
jgi:hypothetical protein